MDGVFWLERIVLEDVPIPFTSVIFARPNVVTLTSTFNTGVSSHLGSNLDSSSMEGDMLRLIHDLAPNSDGSFSIGSERAALALWSSPHSLLFLSCF